jgi:hypothetical protein
VKGTENLDLNMIGHEILDLNLINPFSRSQNEKLGFYNNIYCFMFDIGEEVYGAISCPRIDFGECLSTLVMSPLKSILPGVQL